MSGTSADGVDIAIVRISGRGLGMSAELQHHHVRHYPRELKQAIFSIREAGHTALADLAHLGRAISLEYADAVKVALKEATLAASDLTAIAAHGQTLYHAPPDTIQWLDPSLIAAATGCAVVADFRRADCAAGGQGAPLVPFADYILFRHPTKSRVLLNIGGIANLTYIPAAGTIDQLIAFDTGPGNCISDWLCREHDPRGPGYDTGGALAATAEPDLATAAHLSRCEYLSRRPPKSTDGPEMIAVYLAAKAFTGCVGTFEAELATACAATALCVKRSLDDWITPVNGHPVDALLISGGGVDNAYLMKCVTGTIECSAPIRVIQMERAIAQAKEAIAFALLGAATLDGVPSNVPSCTGAKRAVVLGSVTPKP